MVSEKRLTFLGDYINGQFVRVGSPDDEWTVKSPGNLKDEIITLSSNNDHVLKACEAAKSAFDDWSELSLADRTNYLLKLKEVYASHADEIAETISRETGKPLWDSIGEAKAMIGKFDITINHSMKLVEGEKIENILPNVNARTIFKPRGVMAVLGPFNFPGHLPNGHIVPALLTGNTVVFKPSELTPATGQLIARMFEKAEFPKGVFNLVQGKGDTGRRLVKNELVDGILFTGAYDTGLKIKQETATHFWKILALEMGGKNASIVWNDADIDKAIVECILGSFITSGQRCSCTSRIILNEKIADQFIEKFHKAAKMIKIGHWREDVFMGPVISEKAVEKYMRFQGIAQSEGAETIMRGKLLEFEYPGYYVSPSLYRIKEFNKDSVYQKSEVFGPNVAFFTVSEFDEAIKLNNSTGYGLVTSVFSNDRKNYERTCQKARVGLVNWNKSTAGASSRLPFGGMGKSGNDRPSAHFAVYYCTVPVANMEDSNPVNLEALPKGLDFNGIL